MMRYPKNDTRSRTRRIVDAILLDILFIEIGFFIAVVLASNFPRPWLVL